MTYLYPETCSTSKPVKERLGYEYCLPGYQYSLGGMLAAIEQMKAEHQAIFAHDTSVYCLSIHGALDPYMSLQRVLHQGTTAWAEAVGHCNIPLLSDSFGDDFVEQMNLSGRFYRAEESLPAFEAALAQLPWLPDLLFIFSGYDSHRDDCGRGITGWAEPEFRRLTRLLLDVARRAACPVLSVHGGGDKLPVIISAAISHVETLAGYS